MTGFQEEDNDIKFTGNYAIRGCAYFDTPSLSPYTSYDEASGFWAVCWQQVVACLFRGKDRAASLGFKFLPGVACNVASPACHLSTLLEALRVLCFADFCCGCFSQDVQRKLDVRHVIAQVLFLQAFVLLILLCGLPAPDPSNDIGQRSIVLTLGHSGTVPFVSVSSFRTSMLFRRWFIHLSE